MNYYNPLFTYRGLNIYHHDLQSLQPGQWLTEPIITFYLKYLRHEILKRDSAILLLKPSLSQLLLKPKQETQFLRQSMPPDLKQKELILIPICGFPLFDGYQRKELGSAHWSLLVYVKHGLHAGEPEYHYYDSRRMNNWKDALAIKGKLDILLHAHMSTFPSIEEHSCPQHFQSHDCGVYAIMFTDILVRRYADLLKPPFPAVPPPPPNSLASSTKATHGSANATINRPRRGGYYPGTRDQYTNQFPRQPPPYPINIKIPRPPQRLTQSYPQAHHSLTIPFASDGRHQTVNQLHRIDRCFWWIDFKDVTDPSDARSKLRDLLSRHI